MAKKKVSDPGAINQDTFDVRSKARRNADAGMFFDPIGNLGTSAVRVDQARTILLYNSTGAVIFFKFGDSSIAAPATAADGVPVLAGQTFVANSGPNNYIRASATGLFAYVSEQA